MFLAIVLFFLFGYFIALQIANIRWAMIQKKSKRSDVSEK